MAKAAFLEFFISAVRILTDLGITTRMVLSLTGPDAARESKEFNAWLQAAGAKRTGFGLQTLLVRRFALTG